MNEINFGLYLKNLRKEKGFTTRELSIAADVSQSHISNIENNKRGKPSPDMIKKLAKALKIEYEDLMIKAGYLNDPYKENITIDQFTKGGFDENKEVFVEVDVKYQIPITQINIAQDNEGIDNISVQTFAPDEIENLKKLPYSLDYLLDQGKPVYYRNRELTKEQRKRINLVLDAILTEI